LNCDRWFLLLNISFAQALYIATLSGIAKVKAYTNTMSAAATIDHLTGISNRRSAAHTLQEKLREAQLAGHPLSFILLDVDHFKRINDTFGHDVGDQVLIDVAATLRRHLRASDQIGSVGRRGIHRYRHGNDCH